MAGFTPGQAFLGALLNSKDQKGVSFGDNMLMAHVSPDGGPHSGGPEHDFMHGRRGSGTWGDGTSKTEPRFNQDGRTFADGTPLTSKNYEDFQINPDGEEGPDMILVKDRPVVESKSSITDAAVPSSGGANNSIQISFIATIPKNNFLKYVIDNVVKDILARRYNRGVLDITGPAAFGRIFSHFFQYENDMDTSFVEPKKLTGLDGKTYKISIPLRQGRWRDALGEDGEQLEDIKTNKAIVKTKIKI